ncbi:MAG TPA: hypothetical protein VEA80_00955 [Vitreimonas sp.]|uniref:hypothetical protein n=1 Tax=Vitreimonas sp. TaxID=3069702 RepID=UPI002D4F5704|nr:hypothetical protein [Vitreimonas sp.]HYD86020.1 hypothetical protein [Vitreimonas sp.]
MLITANESFLGPDAVCVREEVRRRRAFFDVREVFRGGAYCSFEHLLGQERALARGLLAVLALLRRHRLEPLPLSRYYLYRPTDADHGGFHSRHAHGFRYLDLVGYAVAITDAEIGASVRALDALRAYVHDCIHNATYRTFRRGPDGRIFREQYGFNFRRWNGLSYSPARQTACGSINLNLLMDGIVVLKTAELLSHRSIAAFARARTPAERMLVADVRAELEEIGPQCPSWSFHQSVTNPTLEFLERYDSPALMEALYRAMLTGQIREAAELMRRLSGRGWRDLFMSSAFSSAPGPRPEEEARAA